MERWGRSATRWSRGIRRMLTEAKAEELVSMDGCMGWGEWMEIGSGSGGRRVETGV